MNEEAAMPKFQYLIGGLVRDGLTPEDEQEKLNECGADGWELTAVSHRDEYAMYYFRRVIAECLP